MLARRARALVALLVLLTRARARRTCNTARYGLQQGREVHIQDQRMTPYAPDWRIIVPPVCERIVGVSATACDADGAPGVFMSSLTRGLVIRDGALSTGAYLYVTVFCDPNELNPELLELMPNADPSLLHLPSSRYRLFSRSDNLPWLVGSRPQTSISPEHLIMLNFPRWPNAEPAWPEQPVILDVKSYLVPDPTYAALTAGPFRQIGHYPLRHPRLLLSRSPATEFPGPRWAGLDPPPPPEPDPVPDHAPDQEDPGVMSDAPEHEQATAESIEPAHNQEQEGSLDAEPDHDESQASTAVEHDGALAAAGESDGSDNDGMPMMPMSGEASSEEGSNDSRGESHHHFRPLMLARHLAQWWKHVHGALRKRRMPRRRTAARLPPLPLRVFRPPAERSDVRRGAPLYYWRD